MKAENKRLLEAFEYLDAKYIDELFNVLDTPPRRNASYSGKRSYWYIPVLAACLLLLAFASPVINKVAEVISSFAAGLGSGMTESSETLNTLSPEQTETDPYSISQEELDEINTAWAKHENNENAIFCKNIEDLKYLSGYRCFYGKYNGCIILARRKESDDYFESYVNGYLFKLPSCDLWVCRDGEYYSLFSAYENGWLTDQNIGEIYNIHNENIYGHLND